MKQLMMTLVALLAVTTGAWAESKPIGLNVEYAVGDVITSTTDVYVYYGEQPSTSKQMAVKITSTGPLTIVEIYAKSFAIEGECPVYYMPSGESTGGYAGAIPCLGESTGDATVVHVASGSGTLADPYVFAPGAAASGTPVALTWDATAKTATLTNGMPAGNVTVSVEYYPQATAEGAVTAATGVKATTDAALVTIDENKLTGVAKMMYYVSADAEATAPAYDAEGWTDKVPTAENYTEAGNLKVWYYPVGTDEGVGGATATYSDGDMNATALAVSLGDAPTYAVTLNAEGLSTDEAANWKVAKGDATPAAFPLEGVKKGETVTVTYSGTRKVIGVKAEKKAEAPHLVMEDKNNYFGIGNQKFYFTEGETWIEAMTNHPENAAAGWILDGRVRFKPGVYGYGIFILRSDNKIIEEDSFNQPIDSSKTYSFSGTKPT